MALKINTPCTSLDASLLVDGPCFVSQLSVQEIANWMSSFGTDPLMVKMIELYLLAKDFRTMLDGVTYPGDDLELQD